MTGDHCPDREPSPVIRRDVGHHRSATRPTVGLPRPQRLPRIPAPDRRDKPGRRRKRARGRLISLSLPAIVLLLGAGTLSGALWLDGTLHRGPVLTAYPGRPAAGRGTTWLLVGSDGRQGLTADQQLALTTGGDLGTGRTDTILLVHEPAFGSHTPTSMVSIPRDSYVPIPGYGRDKINAAYVRGGAALLAQTVEQATGLRIDHYAEIGFGGFAGLVDALGGVTVCPAAPITDPLAGIDLPAGCRRLDGREALGYVRTRATPRADLDRMVNQRAFISALLRRVGSPAVWLNPWRWYAVPHAAAEALILDRGFHVWDLARLGWSLRGSTAAMTVPIGQFTGSDSGSVVLWDRDAAAALFDALASDAPLPGWHSRITG